MTHHDQAELNAIIKVASCLARNGTARFSRQRTTIGPNRGCASSQFSQRSLPREKQNAASNTNGVVGSIGKKIPMMPSSNENAPATNQSARRERDVQC